MTWWHKKAFCQYWCEIKPTVNLDLLKFKWWGLERICGASSPKVVFHHHLDLKDDNKKHPTVRLWETVRAKMRLLFTIWGLPCCNAVAPGTKFLVLYCSYSLGTILNAQYSVLSWCCNTVAAGRVIPFWYAWYLSCSCGTALSNNKCC